MAPDISDNTIHTLRKQIGERILNARRTKGMTQEQLAKTANINQGDLSQIENGLASLGRDRAERIGAVLNIDPDTINIRKQLIPQPAVTPAVYPAGKSPQSPPAGLSKNQTPGSAAAK